MATTFNLELDTKPNKKGCFCVFIRITQNRTKKRVKTSVSVKRQSDWNKEKQCVRISEPNSKAWNMVLDKELEKAKTTYRDLEQEGKATSQNVINRLKTKEVKLSLLAFSKQVQNNLLLAGKLGNWNKYGSFIVKLEGYLLSKNGGVDPSFSEITPDFVTGFTSYLFKLPNYRDQNSNLHPNTINKLLRILRAILNKAIEAGYMKPENNPFKLMRIKKDIFAPKEKLSSTEIEAILGLELEEGSLLWSARNAFFFSFYCAGIRVGDLIQLRWNNIDTSTGEERLVYQMAKNHKAKNIILVPQAKEILLKYRKGDQKGTDYIFPYLDNFAQYAKAVTLTDRDRMATEEKKKLFVTINAREVQINKQLNKLAKLAGITKHLSFHISRHSFAKIAKQAGTDNQLLKGLLNHSSLIVTDQYMAEFDTRNEDQALLSIFDKSKKEDEILALLKGIDKEKLNKLLAQL